MLSFGVEGPSCAEAEPALRVPVRISGLQQLLLADLCWVVSGRCMLDIAAVPAKGLEQRQLAAKHLGINRLVGLGAALEGGHTCAWLMGDLQRSARYGLGLSVLQRALSGVAHICTAVSRSCSWLCLRACCSAGKLMPQAAES